MACGQDAKPRRGCCGSGPRRWPDPEHGVDLVGCQRPVMAGRGDHEFAIELDLLELYGVVQADVRRRRHPIRLERGSVAVHGPSGWFVQIARACVTAHRPIERGPPPADRQLRSTGRVRQVGPPSPLLISLAA